MRWIVFAVLAASSFSAVAGTLDINLSNDTIEAKYDSPVGASCRSKPSSASAERPGSRSTCG